MNARTFFRARPQRGRAQPAEQGGGMIAKRIALVLGALLLATGSALASGFHTGEYHAAYTGQATAGLTLTENAGVVAQLPAAMVRLPEGTHALGGLNYYVPKFDYTATETGETGSTITDPILGPFAYGAYNGGSWAMGAGLYFPFNVDIEYPADWAGRRLLTREQLNVGYFSVTGAYALNEDLSLGLAVNFIGARVVLDQTQVVSPGTEVPTELGGSAQTTGYGASALYELDHWSVGFTYSPGYDIEGEGKARFDTAQEPALASLFADGDVKVTLHMPSLAELGVAYKEKRRDPDYTVELSVIRTGWSRYSDIKVQFTSGLPQSEQVLKRGWKDTTGVKVGGNYVFSRSDSTSHRVRGGIYLDQSPIPATTLEPSVPDGEGRTDVALGYGFRSGPLAVNASYFLIMFKDSQTAPPNEFPAKYGGTVPIYAVDVGYQF